MFRQVATSPSARPMRHRLGEFSWGFQEIADPRGRMAPRNPTRSLGTPGSRKPLVTFANRLQFLGFQGIVIFGRITFVTMEAVAIFGYASHVCRSVLWMFVRSL